MAADAVMPVGTGDHLVYLTVRDLGGGRLGEETEVAARQVTLDGVLGGVRAFAEQVLNQLRGAGVSKATVEFGCEFGLESGSLVAIVGKASSKSVMKVGLEWSNPSGQ